MSEEMSKTISECYIDVYGVRPTVKVIFYTYKELSGCILLKAYLYGWDNEIVKDDVLEWMKIRTTFL